MGWVVALFALAGVALLGIALDVIALRRRRARALAVAALVLKALVVVAFGVWFLIFQVLTTARGWEDLASFAAVLVASIGLLGIAVILDAIIAWTLTRDRGSSA